MKTDPFWQRRLQLIENRFKNRDPEARRMAEQLRDTYATKAHLARSLATVRMTSDAMALGDGVEGLAGEHFANFEFFNRRASEVDKIVQKYKNLQLNQQKDLGTPETEVKAKLSDQIIHLYGLRHLTEDQVRAARIIAAIYETVTRASGVKPRPIICEGRGTGSSRDFIPWAEWVWKPYWEQFCPWCREVKQLGGNLDLILDVVVLNHSIRQTRAAYRIGPKKALNHIQAALALWVGRRYRLDQDPELTSQLRARRPISYQEQEKSA